MTLEDIKEIVQPHNDKIVAEAKLENARDALRDIMGRLGAARVQRSQNDDAIIGAHIDAAYEIARATLGSVR